MDFGKEKYVSLGIVNSDDGLFTNLALLLSDECEYTIKAAIFEGNNKKILSEITKGSAAKRGYGRMQKTKATIQLMSQLAKGENSVKEIVWIKGDNVQDLLGIK